MTAIWLCFCCLSTIASSLLVFLFWRLREWDSPVQIVLYMAVSDLFVSFDLTMAFARPFIANGALQASDGFCTMSFLVLHIFIIGTFLWYFMMAVNIFFILHGYTDEKMRAMRKWQHLFVWSYAICGTLPPLVLKKYSPMSYADYCYFPDPDDPLKLIVYAPLCICLIFCIFLFFYALLFFLCRRNQVKTLSTAIIRRLGFMVFLFVVTWSLAVYSRLGDAVGHPEPPALQLVGMTLGGFFNFIVWGATNQKVINYIKTNVKWIAIESRFDEHDTAAEDVDYSSFISGTRHKTQLPHNPSSTSAATLSVQDENGPTLDEEYLERARSFRNSSED